MSFNYETRKKSTETRQILEQEEHFKTINKQSKSFGRLGDHERVIFKRDKNEILDLRISGTAIENESCGLKGLDIQEWLYEIGIQFLDEITEYTTLMIASTDVVDGRLRTSWQELTRIQD